MFCLTFKNPSSHPKPAELEEDKDIFGNVKQRAQKDYYYSDEGFIVFTEEYHLRRGYCCQSGCKHCPYGFDKKTGQVKKG